MEENELENMNFEQALRELEDIVAKLETGEGSLEASIAAYERGVELKKYCEKRLQEAQAKIEKITITPDGEIKTEEFDLA